MKKYTREPFTIRRFRDVMYHTIDCQPVGQRLPIYSPQKEKSVGIISSIWYGVDIGKIIIMKLNRKERRAVASIGKKFKYESIDGGHRKRSLWDYLNDGFEVNGKFFSELSDKEQEDFLNIELDFTIYDELDAASKGWIFRTVNMTTDVNFIERLNSYGDIPIANYIRETVRRIPQIENPSHDLFDHHTSNTDPEKYIFRYLSFDNDRLKQDHAFARIVYRYITSPEELLGGAPDKEIQEMYENEKITKDAISKVKNKIKLQLDFTRVMADYRKKKFSGKGLSQHDFKVLSYLYFYLVDTYKIFEIKDYEGFFKSFATANSKLMNKDGEYAKIVHKPSGYSVQIMYKKYIAAPWDTKKLSMALSYLVGEMGDIEEFLTVKDPVRDFTRLEKEARLAEQDFKCAVDGKPLDWKDAHAAHIKSHKKGGKTVYSNLVMVRAKYNEEMGTMDFNDYMSTKKSVA